MTVGFVSGSLKPRSEPLINIVCLTTEEGRQARGWDTWRSRAVILWGWGMGWRDDRGAQPDRQDLRGEVGTLFGMQWGTIKGHSLWSAHIHVLRKSPWWTGNDGLGGRWYWGEKLTGRLLYDEDTGELLTCQEIIPYISRTFELIQSLYLMLISGTTQNT